MCEGELSLYAHDKHTADCYDPGMWTVYILRSVHHPEQRYIGLTNDLGARLAKHNAGGSPHTAKLRPWELETSVGFTDQGKAAAFEKYLKTGSGFAFAKKHF